jgi:hypothetical protein
MSPAESCRRVPQERRKVPAEKVPRPHRATRKEQAASKRAGLSVFPLCLVGEHTEWLREATNNLQDLPSLVQQVAREVQ